MANLGEIEAALEVLERAGPPKPNYCSALHHRIPAPPQGSQPPRYEDHCRGLWFGSGLFRPYPWCRSTDCCGGDGRHGDREAPHPRSQPARTRPSASLGDDFAAMVKVSVPLSRPWGMASNGQILSEQANLPVVRKSLVAARRFALESCSVRPISQLSVRHGSFPYAVGCMDWSPGCP